jgi:hypothetical protein
MTMPDQMSNLRVLRDGISASKVEVRIEGALRVEAKAILDRASSICDGVGCEDVVGEEEMAIATEPAAGVGVMVCERSAVKSKTKPSCGGDC